MPNNKANIYVKFADGKGIYLYTNTDGPQLPLILRNALRRGRERWGDTQSLARIIFAEMTQRSVFGTNDYGISTSLGDNENFILVVDDAVQKIGIFGESGHMFGQIGYDAFLRLNEYDLNFGHLTGGHRIEDDSYGANRRRGDPYPF